MKHNYRRYVLEGAINMYTWYQIPGRKYILGVRYLVQYAPFGTLGGADNGPTSMQGAAASTQCE